jgi:hypothetical protein
MLLQEVSGDYEILVFCQCNYIMTSTQHLRHFKSKKSQFYDKNETKTTVSAQRI